jgi:hypothetical protein
MACTAPTAGGAACRMSAQVSTYWRVVVIHASACECLARFDHFLRALVADHLAPPFQPSLRHGASWRLLHDS